MKETFERCRRKAQTDFPTSARGWITINCAGLTEQEKLSSRPRLRVAWSSMWWLLLFALAFRCTKQVDRNHVGPSEHWWSTRNLQRVISMSVKSQINFKMSKLSWLIMVRKWSRTPSPRARQPKPSPWLGRIDVKRFRNISKLASLGLDSRITKLVGVFASRSRSSNVERGVGNVARLATGPGSVEVQLSHQKDLVGHDITFVGTSEWISSGAVPQVVTSVLAAGLVSSPGCGVIDTGCGRTLIGAQTLHSLNQMLKSRGRRPADEYEALNRFRFGNGQEEVSNRAARIPVAICGQTGVIDAAIISGQAPLLLGRPTLEKLDIRLDFQSSTMCAPSTTQDGDGHESIWTVASQHHGLCLSAEDRVITNGNPRTGVPGSFREM